MSGGATPRLLLRFCRFTPSRPGKIAEALACGSQRKAYAVAGISHDRARCVAVSIAIVTLAWRPIDAHLKTSASLGDHVPRAGGAFGGVSPWEEMAPQVGLEPTTLRLTAGCSAIELLRSVDGARGAQSAVRIHHTIARLPVKTPDRSCVNAGLHALIRFASLGAGVATFEQYGFRTDRRRARADGRAAAVQIAHLGKLFVDRIF